MNEDTGLVEVVNSCLHVYSPIIIKDILLENCFLALNIRWIQTKSKATAVHNEFCNREVKDLFTSISSQTIIENLIEVQRWENTTNFKYYRACTFGTSNFLHNLKQWEKYLELYGPESGILFYGTAMIIKLIYMWPFEFDKINRTSPG